MQCVARLTLGSAKSAPVLPYEDKPQAGIPEAREHADGADPAR